MPDWQVRAVSVCNMHQRFSEGSVNRVLWCCLTRRLLVPCASLLPFYGTADPESGNSLAIRGQRKASRPADRCKDLTGFVIGCSGAWRHALSRTLKREGGQTWSAFYHFIKWNILIAFSLNRLIALSLSQCYRFISYALFNSLL